MNPTGARWYIGITRSGKTTLALEHAAQLWHASSWPLLVLDGERDRRFNAFPRPRRDDPSGLPELLWSGARLAAITPRDEDFERVIELTARPGRLIVFVDGAHRWLSAHEHVQAPLVAALREHAHRQVALLLTTHHLSGDVPAVAVALAPDVYMFRTTSRGTLKLVRDEFGVDPSLIRSLAQFEYLRISPGFQSLSR